MSKKTSEWHAARREGIGGSDWQDILGIQPFGCRRRVWLEKLGTEPIEDEETPDMARGNALEPIIGKLYAEREHRAIRRPSRRNRKGPHLSIWVGNPDFMVLDDGQGMGKAPLECKSISRGVQSYVKLKGLPLYWFAQVQHYIELLGAKWGALAVLCADSWNFTIHPMERRDDILEFMRTAAQEFWSQVQGKTTEPQRLDPNDSRCQRCRYHTLCHGAGHYVAPAAPLDSVIVSDSKLLHLVQQQQEFMAVHRSAQQAAEEMKSEMKLLMKGETNVVVGPYHLVVSSVTGNLRVTRVGNGGGNERAD